jgi:hypothetical protein
MFYFYCYHVRPRTADTLTSPMAQSILHSHVLQTYYKAVSSFHVLQLKCSLHFSQIRRVLDAQSISSISTNSIYQHQSSASAIGYPLSWPRHWEACGKLHAPAALHPTKEVPVPTRQKDGWIPRQIRARKLREKSSAPSRNVTTIVQQTAGHNINI